MLTADDIADAAAYYASVSAPFLPLRNADPALIKRGEQLAVGARGHEIGNEKIGREAAELIAATDGAVSTAEYCEQVARALFDAGLLKGSIWPSTSWK